MNEKKKREVSHRRWKPGCVASLVILVLVGIILLPYLWQLGPTALKILMPQVVARCERELSSTLMLRMETYRDVGVNYMRRYYRTNDKGQTWQSFFEIDDGSLAVLPDCEAVYIVNNRMFYIWGYNYLSVVKGGDTYNHRTDMLVENGSQCYFGDVRFYNELEGTITLNCLMSSFDAEEKIRHNRILNTIDGGKTWQITQ